MLQRALLDERANGGLCVHSFNPVAGTLADHRMLLPDSDERVRRSSLIDV